MRQEGVEGAGGWKREGWEEEGNKGKRDEEGREAVRGGRRWRREG